MTTISENAKNHVGQSLTIRWGTSRGRNTYGYTTCSLSERGKRIAACNGGGYDMRGTVIGNWIAAVFQKELNALKPEQMEDQSHWEGTFKDGKRISDGRGFYGLSFHDPNYDPGKAVIGKDCSDRTFSGKSEGKTVEQAEKDGDTVGLERYQAFYSASSKVPTERHTIAMIDGACGESSVLRILNALGLYLEKTYSSSKLDIYTVCERKEQAQEQAA